MDSACKTTLKTCLFFLIGPKLTVRSMFICEKECRNTVVVVVDDELQKTWEQHIVFIQWFTTAVL